MKNNKLAIIVPCYNEEDIMEYSIGQLLTLLNTMIADNLISINSKICFVNDGSSDSTAEIIQKHCINKNISLINLIGNSGQQSAILAGFSSVDADMYITIDADLQDDCFTMIEMVKKYLEGNEIVYGCRIKREKDTFLKRSTALIFYKFIKFIGINIRENHSEFRLMSKFAVEKLMEYGEKTMFLRGLVQSISLKSCNVYYERLERRAGNTKYSFFKLFELFWTAVTSFSILPLRLITITGILTSFLSFFVIIYAIISHIKHYSIPGWTSIVIIIAFFSGIIIMSIGIIGEYLAKVLIEVKNRPLYQIKNKINL